MITISKILCPVDFFPASDAAVNYAVGLAAIYDAEIHLLHVVSPIATGGAYEYAVDLGDIVKSMEEASMRELRKLASNITKPGLHVELHVRVGDVYDEIKRTIAMEKPDLIVMGTHGRNPIDAWFVGSTANHVVRRAPCPVLTVKA